MNTSYINVPIKTETFLMLSDFLRECGSDRVPVCTVTTAINYWIDNVSWKKDDLMPELEGLELGYRWKNVFMPHGTRLRIKYKGNYYYAVVERDQLIHEKCSISPAKFANEVTHSQRNAWRDLEIRRPEDNEWVIADVLRKKAALLSENSSKPLQELVDELVAEGRDGS